MFLHCTFRYFFYFRKHNKCALYIFSSVNSKVSGHCRSDSLVCVSPGGGLFPGIFVNWLGADGPVGSLSSVFKGCSTRKDLPLLGRRVPTSHHFILTFLLGFLGGHTDQYEFWPQTGKDVSSWLGILREDIFHSQSRLRQTNVSTYFLCGAVFFYH